MHVCSMHHYEQVQSNRFQRVCQTSVDKDVSAELVRLTMPALWQLLLPHQQGCYCHKHADACCMCVGRLTSSAVATAQPYTP